MFAAHLTRELAGVLERPDLRVIADGRRIRLDPALAAPFRVGPQSGVTPGEVTQSDVTLGEVTLGAPSLAGPAQAAIILRHALELARLLPLAPAKPVLAGLCAARVAALFRGLDGPDGGAMPDLPWLDAMAAERPPDAACLAALWPCLAPLQPAVAGPGAAGADGFTALAARLAALWPLLGPAEALMAEGGDARLAVDPATGLNHYGCSHRPRPWAVTFASSTASSLSERGFAGAEAARLRLVGGALTGGGTAGDGTAGDGAAVRAGMVADLRRRIGRHYRLAAGESVVLAPSGTDCELHALALAALAPGGRAVSNILLAPEETGSGVPLAARGCHFAHDTALGAAVPKGGLIDGFARETLLLSVPLRGPDGALRPEDAVDADCAALVRQAVAAGRHVLLHRLDLSKTGLLAPGMAMLDELAGGGPDGRAPDVVVDACQARLDPERVRAYLDRGWMVMVTGSKFFTGPPFCGALLLPAGVAARLERGMLPAGLAAYSHQSEWPDAPGTAHLAAGENVGLMLRWHAALAEMAALHAIPRPVVRARLARFLDAVEGAIDASGDLRRLPGPAPARAPLADAWDDRATILSFFVRDPMADDGADGGRFVPLGLEDARALYRWLNADLSRLLSAPADRALGGVLCHVGQPVPLPHPSRPGMAGALRLSAGARLVSGEPSHDGLVPDRRMDREIGDARLVLDKIGLILRHWAILRAADPVQTYAPVRAMDGGMAPSR